jgi:hypothetical protein
MALSIDEAIVVAGNICASHFLSLGLLSSFFALCQREDLGINFGKE